jgi:hypothetical protein
MYITMQGETLNEIVKIINDCECGVIKGDEAVFLIKKEIFSQSFLFKSANVVAMKFNVSTHLLMSEGVRDRQAWIAFVKVLFEECKNKNTVGYLIKKSKAVVSSTLTKHNELLSSNHHYRRKYESIIFTLDLHGD